MPLRYYRRKRKKRTPYEFSKKILVYAAIVNTAVIIFTMLMIYDTKNLEPLAYLIPAVATEVATGTGFYYSKAKVENRIKLMKQYKVEPTENSFTETGGY